MKVTKKKHCNADTDTHAVADEEVLPWKKWWSDAGCAIVMALAVRCRSVVVTEIP